MIFSVFTELCNLHHSLILEYFHHPRKKCVPISRQSLFPSSALATTNLSRFTFAGTQKHVICVFLCLSYFLEDKHGQLLSFHEIFFFKQGMTVLMMGSADALPEEPSAKTVFVEDMTEEQLASAVRHTFYISDYYFLRSTVSKMTEKVASAHFEDLINIRCMLSSVNQSFVFEIGSRDPFLIEQFITKSLISVINASGRQCC